MSRFAVPSLVTAVVVLGMGVVAILLGEYLLPSKADAITKGTLAPWFLVWGMIGIVAICTVTLAGFLVMTGIKGLSGNNSPARM